LLGNARFPLGLSVLAFALNQGGSILNTTGPALRDLAGRYQQSRDDQLGARLRSGAEWVDTTHTGGQEKEGNEPGFLRTALQIVCGSHDEHSEHSLAKERTEMPQVSGDEV